MKFRLFRVMRPISWRYDRLIADHAELTTSLAERLHGGRGARSHGCRPGCGDGDGEPA